MRSALVLTLVVASPSALAEPITYVAPQPQTQQNTQQQAQQKNDKGADLSKLLSLLSMAMGAMQMAKGAMDMQKCQQAQSTGQPPPPGSKTGAEEAAVAGMQMGAVAAGNGLGGPTQVPVPTSGNACGDGMSQLAQGAMQMLQGLMGMAGADQGNKNAAVAGTNAAKLGAITPSKIPMGGKTTTGNGFKIDPNLLRNGKANAVLGDFEKKFGIPRDDFANAVFNGVDPREILKSAPTNALSADTMNQAFGGAAKATDLEKAQAAAELAALQKEALENFEIPTSSGTGASKAASKKKNTELAPLDPSLLGMGANDDGSVSPHVQEALDAEAAARELASRAQHSPGDMTIFQQVHSKYKEKYVVLFGISAKQDIGDPMVKRAVASGIGDANGN